MWADSRRGIIPLMRSAAGGESCKAGFFLNKDIIHESWESYEMMNKIRKSRIKTVVLMSVAGCTILASSVWAATEEDTAKETVSEQAAEENDSEKETITVLEELTVTFAEDKTVVISNAAENKAAELYVKKAADEEWGENLLGDLETEPAVLEDVVYDIKMIDEEKGVLLYYNLPLCTIENLQIFSCEDGTYVKYHDTEADQDVDTKEYPVKAFETSEKRYSTARVNVRDLPGTDGNVLETLSLGTEKDVYGECDGWYLVKSKDGYGFVSGDYLTEDKAKAEELVAAEKAAAEAAAQAAVEQAAAEQAAAEQAYQNQNSGSSQQVQEPETDSSMEQVYEVSREQIPGCDDPNHGTIYITYSDGSVAIEEY